jgi:folate-binding protein YgfZ
MTAPITDIQDSRDAHAYRALRTGAAWFDSPVRWARFHGAKTVDVLNGLITNDVATMRAGDTVMAAALSPKGKLVCDMLVLRVADDTFLTGVIDAAADAWLALVRKYVNPRLSKVTDESATFRTFTLLGRTATDIVQGLEGTAELAHVARRPMPGDRAGHLLLTSVEGADSLLPLLDAAGAVAASSEVWTVARVEAGLPLFGVDMDENTIPQEANLDKLGAISFTKGCYTGQETVARIHFRGHVNRHLRGLSSDVPLARGSSLVDATGKVVGDVRSSVVSPQLGPIAIAMVRREVALGDSVQVTTEGGATTARVQELPFPVG